MKYILYALTTCILSGCGFYTFDDYLNNEKLTHAEKVLSQQPSVKQYVVNGKFSYPTGKFNFIVPNTILSDPDFEARDCSLITVEKTSYMIPFCNKVNAFSAGFRPWHPDDIAPIGESITAKRDYLLWNLIQVDTFKGEIITTEFHEDIDHGAYFQHEYKEIPFTRKKFVVGYLLIINDKGTVFLSTSLPKDNKYFCDSQNMFNHLKQIADSMEINL